MKLPAPRGPLGASLTDLLVHPPRDTDVVDDEVLTRWRDAATTADPLTDDDVQLTLWTLYALHYRGFEGVDDAWEWDPGPAARCGASWRTPFEAALRDQVPAPTATAAEREAVAAALFAMTAPGPGRASPATSAGRRTRRRPRSSSSTGRSTRSWRPTRTRGRSRG